MSDDIYLLGSSGGLQPMSSEAYESEALLQDLLSSYPDLLAGGQINPSSPRRWLLVAPEIGIPDVEGGGDRWSLDHLYLDQDAVPTFVEVKRSSDTRIRREVVGQMLDYAANATAYWPTERIRAVFAASEEAAGRDPEESLRGAFGSETDEEAYWADVEANLSAGRLRLVFVADMIPTELQRIVEFLNEQMSRTQVVGVEVKQYVGESHRILVPRAIGLTAEAQQRQSKPGADKRGYQELLIERGETAFEVERLLDSWASDRGVQASLAAGSKGFSAGEEVLVRLFPSFDSVYFYLQKYLAEENSAVVDSVRDAVRTLSGREPAKKEPGISLDTVVENWESVKDRVLDVLLTGSPPP